MNDYGGVNSHSQGQNAQGIRIHTSTSKDAERLQWNDLESAISDHDSPLDAPLNIFDNVALHLIVRGATESIKSKRAHHQQ
jgi:hypothetical protein